jgi:uncharacterized protein YqgV (UPF0045/DUF77 family)
MKATAELQVIPVGAGVSVREEVARVVDLLREYNFIVEPHASGTNIEGRVRGTRVRTEMPAVEEYTRLCTRKARCG